MGSEMCIRDRFHSVQGEGFHCGTPHVFVRFGNCNLRCEWCDTDFLTYEEMDLESIVEKVLSYQCDRVIFTGGEPAMQDLSTIGNRLKEHGISLSIETNGTIVPSANLIRYIDQWNVSPKLRTSGNISDERLVPIALQLFARLPKAFFKFVITAESDIDEVCSLTDQYGIPSEQVLLMPEGRTADALNQKSEWLSEACVRHGVRFTTRLHKILWGDDRGR